MPYQNRSSQVLKKADGRMARFKSIDPALDLGNGLTVQAYSHSIETARQKLEIYNTALANLTQLYHEMLAAEQTVADLNTRMLAAVMTKYGRNSTEYAMAGGRTNTKRKTKPAAIPSTSNSAASPEVTVRSLQSQNGKSNTNGLFGVVQ